MLGSRLKFRQTVAGAALLLGVYSCSGQDVASDAPPAPPTSEAALLDNSEKATPVLDDSAVFADLNGETAEKKSEAAPATEASSDSPFYNPIGGESLARVAYTLYGQRKQALLFSKNPDLKGSKSVASGQAVYFDFSDLKPMPTFLTKDLLDRYPTQLAEKLSGADLAKTSVVVEKGETLQMVSQRLYGTTRYWTEIYLLNREAMSGYDKVKAGTSLTVYQRQPVSSAVAAVEAPKPAAPAPIVEEKGNAVAPPVMEQEVAPPPAPVAADPIPETPPPAQVATPAPEPYVPQAPAVVGGSSPSSMSAFFNNSANARRVVYLALIAIIGGLAFYLTRPKKKTFDMLDVTSNESGRQKLGAQEQKKDIG